MDKANEYGAKVHSSISNTLGALQLKLIELSCALEDVTEELQAEKERNKELEALLDVQTEGGTE